MFTQKTKAMRLKIVFMMGLVWITLGTIQAQIIEGDRLNSEGMHPSFTVKTTLSKNEAESAWQGFARSNRMGRTRSSRGSDEIRLGNPGNTGIRAGELLILSKANQVGNATEVTVWFKTDSTWVKKETDSANYEASLKIMSAFTDHLRKVEMGRDIAVERRVLREMERERARYSSRVISRTERDLRNLEREVERKRKELENQRIELAQKDKQIADQKSKIGNLEKQKKQGN